MERYEPCYTTPAYTFFQRVLSSKPFGGPEPRTNRVWCRCSTTDSCKPCYICTPIPSITIFPESYIAYWLAHDAYAHRALGSNPLRAVYRHKKFTRHVLPVLSSSRNERWQRGITDICMPNVHLYAYPLHHDIPRELYSLLVSARRLCP